MKDIISPVETADNLATLSMQVVSPSFTKQHHPADLSLTLRLGILATTYPTIAR